MICGSASRSQWADWIFLAFVLWFGSYAYLYVFSLGGPKPVYSYFLLLGAAVSYLLYQGGRGQALERVSAQPVYALLTWLGFYLAYGCFDFIRSTQDAVAREALITLGEAVLLTGAFALFMADLRRLQMVTAAFALLALLGTVMNFWDFLDPIFTGVPGRAAGLYVNPNIAGNFIALAMAAGVKAVPRRLRLGFILVSGIGVFVTFSRESWIIWGLATVLLGWQRHLSGSRGRLPMLALAIVIGGGFTGLLFAGKIGSVAGGMSFVRYLTPDTEARLGIGASVLSGDAAAQREALIGDSIREAAAAPWLGHGLGYTDEWRYSHGPHDMYLLFLVEGGIAGAAVYLGLVILMLRFGKQVGHIVAWQIVVSSFFSHNHLEQPAILMMIAFVFAHSEVNRSEAPATTPAHVVIPT